MIADLASLGLPAVVIGFLYVGWLSLTRTLSSGDWPYLYPETIRSLPVVPSAPFLWIEPYYRLIAKFGAFIGLRWELTEKFFWFYPFVLLAVISSWLFVRSELRDVSKKSRLMLAAIGSLIYTTNTYILMVVGGGQLGVAMAYAMAPLVLYTMSRKRRVLGVFTAGFQLMLDPRVWAITMGARLLSLRSLSSFKSFGLLLLACLALNSFWILPNLSSYDSVYKEAINGDVVRYLSFATFSNSLSLTHPNWPENIFGKIYFMRPEFLLLSILAFGSLLSISNIKNQKSKIQIKNQKYSDITIRVFTLLALLGAFLAKGANPPFGEVYVWLSRIPGFLLFRDPTKFYVLLALSFCILIPRSLWLIASRAQTQARVRVRAAVLGVGFLLFWTGLLYPAWSGQLTGTFVARTVPASYVKLKNYLLREAKGHSVLWVPSRQRFGFYSSEIASVESQSVFGEETFALGKILDQATAASVLKEENVGYVVVPYDSQGEMFLTDRAYDSAKRESLERTFDTVASLEKLRLPGISHEIAVYRLRH